MSTSNTCSETLRHEWKFALPGADAGMLRALLRDSARPLRFGDGPVSRVHSIYFDDERMSACRETLAGLGQRTKLRLRWYDRPLPAGGPLFFELKSRRGTLVDKLRLPVALRRLESYRAMVEELSAALPPGPASWLRLRSEPAVLVSYLREHFADRDGRTRITLDYRLAGCDQRGRAAPAARHAAPIDGLVLVEVKAPPGGLEAARTLLYPWRPRLTRSSKYVRCCLATGWGALLGRYE